MLLAGCGESDPGGATAEVSSTTTEPTTTSETDQGVREDEDLSDGTHEVSVDSVDSDAGTVTVDALEVLEGTDAVLAYLADTDGAQLEGPQVYIRDRVERTQELPVDTDGEFAVVFGPTCCEPEQLGWDGFAELADAHFPDVWGNRPPFTAVIEDGTVTSLVQIYVP